MKNAHPDTAAKIEEQAALWAARLDGAVLSAEDRAALDTWLAEHPDHRTVLSQYCQFSADLEQQLPLIEGIGEMSAGARTARETAQPLPWLRWSTMTGVVLTAAAAVAGVFWLARPAVPAVNVATSVAQRQEITLADGTRVALNAQTALVVDVGGAERRVRLADGQAFFSVHKDPARPFIVETPGGSVRVTGTRFDVRAESGPLLEVIVAEGSVQVRAGGSEAPAAILGAGDRLSAGPRGTSRKSLSPAELDDALAWRHGQIVFDGVPLREALARFARYHGRGITATPEAAGLRVGGRFSLDDLDGFFSALEEVWPLKVSRNLNGTVEVGLRSGH